MASGASMVEVVEMRRTSEYTSGDEIEVCLVPNDVDQKLKLPSEGGCRWDRL